MTNTAAVLESVDTLDTFATPTAITVQASKIRECMVLLDPELGTPLYWVDHRVRSARNSGDAKFLAHNLETGRLETLTIFGATAVPVMAR